MFTKKYEFVEEPTPAYAEDGTLLRRIRALVDIPKHGVKAGDLGGFIESEANLSHGGIAWIEGDAHVWGDARVMDAACVTGRARVSCCARILDDAIVADSARISGRVTVSARAVVCGFARAGDYAVITGYSTIRDYAEVCGDARILDNAFVTGRAKINGKARVCSYANISHDGVIERDVDYITFGPDHVTGSFITIHQDSRIGVRVNMPDFSGSLEEAQEHIKALALSNQRPFAGSLLDAAGMQFNAG